MSGQTRRGAASASRRSLPKSHRGCKTCKSRKIKCDEQKPACGNCIKHNVDCDFAARSDGVPSLSPHPHSLSPHPVQDSQEKLNVSHLALLHNFTTRTYFTLSDSPILREFYRMTAVQLGLECDYIMRSLLAISALHLAHSRPAARDHYQELAMMHHQIATREAMPHFTDVMDPSAASNLFLFSSLTLYFALGCSRRDEGTLLIGESGFPEWPFLLTGTQALYVAVSTQVDSPLAPVLNHGKDRWVVRESRLGSASPAHAALDGVWSLIALRQPDNALRETYLSAIEKMKKSFSMLEAAHNVPWEITDAFVWIFEVVDDFMPLLRESKQEAVAIFAFFAILLKRLDGHWFMRGWADHLIAKSHSILDNEHRLWIQWPLEEMGYTP